MIDRMIKDRRVGTSLLVLCLLVGCKSGLSPEDIARLRALAATSQARSTQLDEARRTGVAQLMANPNPTAPNRCQAGIDLRRSQRVDNFVRMATTALPHTKYGHAPPTIAESKGLRTLVANKVVDELRYIDDKTPKDREAGLARQLQEIASPTYWHPYEIDFVITKLDPPRVAFNHFDGGHAEGRVVVWNWERGAPACWAPVASALGERANVGSKDQEDSLLGQLYLGADQRA